MTYSFAEALSLRQAAPEIRQQHQLKLLRNHLRQAGKSRHYSALFEKHGIRIEEVKSLTDLHLIPFTTRNDLDSGTDAFSAVPKEQFADIAFTSGTTGESLAIPYTVADLDRLAVNEAINFYSTGIRSEDIALLSVTLDRCFVAGLAYYSGLVRLGAAVIRSGAGQPARQWELLTRCRATVLVGVPSFLLRLGQWALDNGKKPRDTTVHSLITIGEPVRKGDLTTTALGQHLEEMWGATIFSSYGSTEIETAFCDCTGLCGGHAHPELMLVEIVDAEGNCLPDGQLGEVVVTPLGVEGFPLLRFRTGDVARLHTISCRCGWQTPRLGPIEGRLAQRLKYKGTTLYPEMIFQALEEVQEIESAYIEIRSAFDLSDQIEVVAGLKDGIEISAERIADHLRSRLRVRPEISLKKESDVLAKMTETGSRKLKRVFDLREVK